MTYKVVKNASGEVVAFGPDTSGYQPGLPAGGSLEVTETAPTPPPPSKEQRTTARAQQAGYATKGHLYDAIENARFRASVKLGITEEQAHLLGIQHNTMYQIVWAAWEDILAIEAEP